MKPSDTDEIPGATLHAATVVDTILGYLADGVVEDLEPIDPYEGPSSVEESLLNRRKALLTQTEEESTRHVQIAKIDGLLDIAEQIRVTLASAISYAEMGEYPYALRPQKITHEQGFDEYDFYKFITASVYSWALDAYQLRIEEWAPAGTSTPDIYQPQNSSVESTPPLNPVELSQLVLADMIRQFMIAVNPSWLPGQEPDLRPTNKYIRSGKLNVRSLTNDITPESTNADATADERTTRDKITDVLPLVEGEGEPKKRTEKSLPGYYRTIYWMAQVLANKLSEGGHADPGNPNETGWPPEIILTSDRHPALVSDAQLRQCLVLAKERRLP